MQPDQGGNYWRGDEEEAPAPPSTPQAAPAPEPQPIDPPLDEGELDDQDPLIEPVSWDASEYIHHDRDGMWFIGFSIVTLLLVALSIFLLSNYFFTALIVTMAIALFIYARRPPRVEHYTLNSEGLGIGQKFYSFNQFRAFGVVEDGALYSVRLLPTARFGQALTIYFAENDGERIVDILGAYLPMENLRLDLLDVLLRRLRL
jgi:hypothetical protein